MRLIDATLLLLACFESYGAAQEALTDGSVGCLFNNALCKEDREWCFDDHAFGQCVSYEEESDEVFYRYDLNSDSLFLLKQELSKLIKEGYRWSHFYTQCVLKALLFAFRYQKAYDENSCDILSQYDAALSYFEESPEEIDPQSVGQVQFTPSVIDPHAEFADEIYIPVTGRDSQNDGEMPLKNANYQLDENYVNDILRTLQPKNTRKSKKRAQNGSQFDAYPEYLAYLNEIPKNNYENFVNNYDFNDKTSDKYELPENGYVSPNRYSEYTNEKYGNDYDDLSVFENILSNDRNILKSFTSNYNTPEKFRNGQETKDEVFYPKMIPFLRFNRPVEYYYPESRQFVYDNYNAPDNDELTKNDKESDGVYTEGGIVYLKDDRKGELNQPDSLEEFVNTYGNWGFKRPERLDVKKPGPAFSTNNYAFENGKNKPAEVEKEAKKNRREWVQNQQQKSQEKILAQPEKKKGGSPMESPSLRKQTTTVQPLKEKESDVTDDEYAYIVLKNRVNTWQEGSRMVRKIEDLLNLRQNTIVNIRVDQNYIKFKVDANRSNLNASDIVRRIESMKDAINRAIGIEIVSARVANLNHSPESVSLLGGDERQLWILSFLLCAVIAAVVIVGAAFFIIKRHPHGHKKIETLSQMDSEASKDYQDLCRARMASKTVQDKPENNIASHRVTNLTKEAEGVNHSPSSRSSTSSWSEEPALTNMDISTGHMVLSYMEDHLKNKDRLEQEWIALCAYEAEPCATIIALKEENAKKNRYTDVLPYDHARVILNELSNVSGSSYINASTITDHDPRNPAYIATQGPLPQTTTDFWQMVWEQGSVVMVMLTRLSENGTAMCHRYWPEEGSELYHIYEVHLVSEHIWCDDYLVRSFYLKNIKTGETRTVTQFHFLSWPENGVPLSTKALLEFRRKVNKSYRGRSCPVVVHCSDGVGRTGTYCLIDMVLNRMAKGAKEIDIAATLEHIRDQRPLMVRTKQQFEFVLMAVAEEVHAILKALPANPNHSPPPVLKEKD